MSTKNFIKQKQQATSNKPKRKKTTRIQRLRQSFNTASLSIGFQGIRQKAEEQEKRKRGKEEKRKRGKEEKRKKSNRITIFF